MRDMNTKTIWPASKWFADLASGKYLLVIAKTIDSEAGITDVADVPWIIGALTFVGRLLDADALLERYQAQMSVNDLVVARFYCAVATCRHGKDAAARAHLRANLQSLSECSDPFARFFIYQGVAFYRYATGDLLKAKKAVDRAQHYAVTSQQLYARVFAQDLKGHLLINLGNVRSGLTTLRQARDLASNLGAGNVAQGLECSVLLYEATHFVDDVDVLEQKFDTQIQSAQFEDSYSRASLLIELGHFRTLQGRMTDAKKAFDRAFEYVYQHEYPVLDGLINLRLAYWLSCKGQYHEALQLLRHATLRLTTKTDRLLRRKISAFESVLRDRLNIPQITVDAPTDCIVDRRISARNTSERQFQSVIATGEDPLGDLFDLAASSSACAIPDVLEKRIYGLLPKLLNVQPGEKVLYFDLEEGSLTLFDQGEVIHASRGLSSLGRKLLLALYQGFTSKEDIVKQVWGFQYHSLRHDSVLYALISKVRRLLGARSDWIESTDDGYRLKGSVKVRTQIIDETVSEEVSAAANDIFEFIRKDGLNPRQMKVLACIESGVHEPRRMRETLGISEATLFRDLKLLVEKDLAARHGQGRAATYIRHESRMGGSL